MEGDEELLTYTSRFLAWSATCNDSGAWGVWSDRYGDG
jgi:hypothetical protein